METPVAFSEANHSGDHGAMEEEARVRSEDTRRRISQKEKAAEHGGKALWRGANLLMTAFFIMAAGVQFNDPDPFLWVPLYGTAAILTVCIAVRPNLSEHKKWLGLYWTHAAFCLGMFFYVLVELLMALTNPDAEGSFNPLTHEEGRELAGVMITTIWLFTCKQSPTVRCTLPVWRRRCKVPLITEPLHSVKVVNDGGQMALLSPE